MRNIDVRGGYCGVCGHALLCGYCPEHNLRVKAMKISQEPKPDKPTALNVKRTKDGRIDPRFMRGKQAIKDGYK